MTLRILGGQHKGRILQSPKNKATRPTQGILRQAVFNICQHFVTGSHFLDLFAGSGAMGLEALSRGAAKAVFVEQDKGAICCIRENISLLHAEKKTALIASDLFSALKTLGKQHQLFDLIYIDPPYGKPQLLIEALEALEKEKILAPGCLVFIENSVQERELTYKSFSLKLHDVRRFGIARLYQFYFDLNAPLQ